VEHVIQPIAVCLMPYPAGRGLCFNRRADWSSVIHPDFFTFCVRSFCSAERCLCSVRDGALPLAAKCPCEGAGRRPHPFPHTLYVGILTALQMQAPQNHCCIPIHMPCLALSALISSLSHIHADDTTCSGTTTGWCWGCLPRSWDRPPSSWLSRAPMATWITCMTSVLHCADPRAAASLLRKAAQGLG
jgi:hypothetical protein